MPEREFMVQDWNPEPQVTRKPHCCEVEINPRSEAIRHYKERIAALEAELKAANEKISEWREAAFPGDQVHAYERTPDGLKRCLPSSKPSRKRIRRWIGGGLWQRRWKFSGFIVAYCGELLAYKKAKNGLRSCRYGN